MKVGVIGLGSMGLGAAVSAVRAGLDVMGIDLNPEARSRFSDAGGQSSDQLTDLCGADVVMVFVVNAQQASDVLQPVLIESLAPDACVVNCVTLAPNKALALADRVEKYGRLYLDAPVSGGAVRAMQGEMSVMAAGVPAAFERAQPVLDAVAGKVFELGDRPGPGSRMKTVNQLLAGVHIAAAAEAMALAAQMDMDMHQVLDVIKDCAGTSWMFENRGPHIAEGDYRPRSMVDIFVKDLGIVSEATDCLDSLPMTTTALELFSKASAQGMGKMDDSAVALLLARRAGCQLPGDPEGQS